MSNKKGVKQLPELNLNWIFPLNREKYYIIFCWG